MVSHARFILMAVNGGCHKSYRMACVLNIKIIEKKNSKHHVFFWVLIQLLWSFKFNVDGLYHRCFTVDAMIWNCHFTSIMLQLSCQKNLKQILRIFHRFVKINLGRSGILFQIYLPYKHTTRILRWSEVETTVSTMFQQGIHLMRF